ncbi:MAG: hypothetical protein ACXV3F_05820 [Frankiaceae bacterium]
MFLRRFLRRHAVLIVVLLLGAAVRTITFLGFRPVIWFFGDSAAYLRAALHLRPDPQRTVGYSLFLAAVHPLHQLWVVAVVQHSVGVAVGVGVYIVLLRLGIPKWGAAAAAAVVLLDGYQVAVEQMVMAETLFTALVLAACLLLAPTPSAPTTTGSSRDTWRGIAGGLLLGLASTVRTVGIPLVIVAVLVLLARRMGARAIAATIIAFVLPIFAYCSWYHASYGSFRLTASTGRFLYGRVMSFADCSHLSLPPAERALCPPEQPPPAKRSVEFYTWGGGSPYELALHGSPEARDNVTRDFARRVISQQPAAYLGAVATDLGRSFAPGRTPYPSVGTYDQLRLNARRGVGMDPEEVAEARVYQRGEDGTPHPGRAVSRLMDRYQQVVYVPGPAYLAAALLGIFAAVPGRRRNRHGGSRSVVATTAALFTGIALLLFVIPALTATFDYRYQLPPLPLLAVAAPLGVARLSALVAAARRPRSPVPADTTSA